MGSNIPRHNDAAVAAVYNDLARYPRLEDVAAELGYQLRHLNNRLKAIRQIDSAALIDRQKAYYHNRPKQQPETGRYLVAVKPKIERWLLTSAQDDTALDKPFWRNLLAYADDLGAEVLVGGFTYNKGLFEDHASRSAVFASEVQPYLRHENVMCGPLLFAAKMNIMPTAVRPLSGLDGYSRGAWAVFPHAKRQLLTVPAVAGNRPSMVMTSACCTVPNYIEKKAGLKAEFHHQIGATIVELDAQDRLFVRQITAAHDGSFQDLDTVVRSGQVSRGHRIEQITFGDIHWPKLDPEVALATWGFDVASGQIVSTDSICHTLRPRHQAFHDLHDHQARNHHRRSDPHFAAAMVAENSDCVETELRGAAQFLRATAYEWTTSVVVASNHNDALVRWLREADPRMDPVNMRYWCELNCELLRRIQLGEQDFDIFAWALQQQDAEALRDIVFVPRNGSYIVCQAAGGIETGLHGDEGPNGARGSPLNMNRMAIRINRGHDHSPSWVDGVCTSGLSGLMRQGYNSGPSSWLHTHTLTYPDAKRTLITLQDGKYRA